MNRILYSLLMLFTVFLFSPELSAENKWPKIFFVSCGDLNLKFDRGRAYSICGIIYKSKQAGVLSDNGAYYGTVFCFPGMKFIGTGHTENEIELVESIELNADGRKIMPENIKDGETIICESFIFIKKSRVKYFSFQNIIEINAGTLKQKSVITADAETQLHLFYNFMMPWSTDMSNYIAEDTNGVKEEGRFVSDNKFLINKEVKWVALYSEKLKAGNISFIGESPAANPSVVMLWDRNVYHKFYLRSFLQKSFPKGFEAVYNLKTIFFEAEKDTWHDAVLSLISKNR